VRPPEIKRNQSVTISTPAVCAPKILGHSRGTEKSFARSACPLSIFISQLDLGHRQVSRGSKLDSKTDPCRLFFNLRPPRTRRGVVDHVIALPKAAADLPHWQTEVRCLIAGAEKRSPVMIARIAIAKALAGPGRDIANAAPQGDEETMSEPSQYELLVLAKRLYSRRATAMVVPYKMLPHKSSGCATSRHILRQ
jgi:hypothetical protein